MFLEKFGVQGSTFKKLKQLKEFKYRFNAIENGVTKRIYKNSKWFFIVFLECR